MEFQALHLDSVSKRYGEGASAAVALDDVSLSVTPGEFIVVVGGNGSGKTTLLELIAGSLSVTGGRIRVVADGQSLAWSETPAWRRASFIAQVHQNPAASTVADFTVAENLRLALLGSRQASLFASDFPHGERERLREALSSIGLQKDLDTYVEDLSQGQRQLLAVFTALQRRPALLLVDEHTSSLDRRNAAECMRLTEFLCREAGVTVLMVTHNFVDALAYGDRLVVLRDGKIVADAAVDEKKALTVAALHELCGF